MHHAEKPELARRRVTFGHLLLEAGLIVFSILVALSLESWREHRNHEEIAQEALAKIKLELERNVAEINKVLPMQKASIDELAKLEAMIKANSKKEVTMQTGLNAPVLSAAAWESAMATQALAYMDFATVLALSEIYGSRKWMERLEDQLVSIVIDPASHTKAAAPQLVISLKNTMAAYVGVEEEIIKLSQAQLSPDGAAESK